MCDIFREAYFVMVITNLSKHAHLFLIQDKIISQYEWGFGVKGTENGQWQPQNAAKDTIFTPQLWKQTPLEPLI